MIHYLYKTTCNLTNRYYIGIHSTNNLEDGYMGSGKRLIYSIRKYGIDNHTKEILEFFETREDLTKREIEIVNSDLIKEVNCMNLVLGGGGFMLDDYHYQCSKEGGLKWSKIRKNDIEIDKNYREKLSKTTKNGIEKGKIKTWKDNYNWVNKKHSEETKNKMSESSKGMGIGETNSQYGTCWITMNGLSKKIKKEDLETYLNEGWVKGRK